VLPDAVDVVIPTVDPAVDVNPELAVDPPVVVYQLVFVGPDLFVELYLFLKSEDFAGKRRRSSVLPKLKSKIV
jgi:hypothetical protein